MGGVGLSAPKFKGILVQVTSCQERKGRVGRKISFWEFWKEDAEFSVCAAAAPGSSGSPRWGQPTPKPELTFGQAFQPLAVLWGNGIPVRGKTHKSNSTPVEKQCKGKARNQWSNNPQHSNKTNILLCQKRIHPAFNKSPQLNTFHECLIFLPFSPTRFHRVEGKWRGQGDDAALETPGNKWVQGTAGVFSVGKIPAK